MFELVFLTSNKAKLAHARYLCRKYNIQISKQKNYGISYVEPRIDDREELLRQSIVDAVERWNKVISKPGHRMFFIEDTSVIIHALSKDKEVPGVDVKYWMKEIAFGELDEQLKLEGNDRSVTVRSDVVLVLDELIAAKVNKEYVRFTSSTDGYIVDKERDIKTQGLYPWLDSKTFNKWFVPNGESDALSCLDVEVADKYDFRKKAFEDMLKFLESNGRIRQRSDASLISQQLAFSFMPALFVVCGPTCAGKTTLAENLADKYGYYHFEASDYMRRKYYEYLGVNSEVRIGDFAKQVLDDEPLIVVSQIIDEIESMPDLPVVITGFRAVKEVEGFFALYNGGLNTNAVFVDADKDLRFDRCRKRARVQSDTYYDEFSIKDEQQWAMGLAELSKELSDSTIFNNQDMSDYFDVFYEKYKSVPQFIPEQTACLDYSDIVARINEAGLESAILISLFFNQGNGKYYTTTEISKLINNMFNDSGLKKNKNNVSRYFNQYYYPYYELKSIDGKNKFRLSQTGKSRAKYVLIQKGGVLENTK